ncbi:AAA family ATPase [Sorangium sp. So ce124]|uniref:AAA family ATPase n=1 Tax=Sorangium sp. So ce124 TaxID=3133280 RepID=UPI003F620939
MITKVFARNYRSIGEVELPLAELTTLVGPNASGKSNIVDAVRFLADCLRAPLGFAMTMHQRQGFGSLLHQGDTASLGLTVGAEVCTDGGLGVWAFTLQPAGGDGGFEVKSERAAWVQGGAPGTWAGQELERLLRLEDVPDLQEALRSQHGSGFVRFGGLHVSKVGDIVGLLSPPTQTALALPQVSHEALRPLADELSRVAMYSLFPNELRPPRAPNPERPMMANGENWAWTLSSLDKERWGDELLCSLSRIAGDVDDYRVIRAGGFLIPEFRHGVDASGDGRWRGAAQESDGTLRVAAILTALFQEPPLSLVGVEEPELAVHPGALPVLFDFLSEASRRSQILLTTHSPDLLDLLPVDSLRVVERRGGATTVSRVDERQRDLVRKRLMSTSDLLHAEGLRPEGSTSDG